MGAIFKREFRAYFTNMTGYVFLGVIFLFSGIFTMAVNLLSGYASFEYTLSNMSFVLMIIIPVLTMRSMAEDRRQRTDQLLYSLPLRATSVVIGKYLALISVFAIAVLGMAFVPVILSLFGSVPFASTYSALFGFLLLGCALIAVCMFLSSLTESQIIAAVIGIGAMLAFYLMNGLSSLIPSDRATSFVCFLVLCAAAGLVIGLLTKNVWIGAAAGAVTAVPTVIIYLIKGDSFAGLFPKLLGFLAVFDRFDSFVNGIFDVSAIVYYLSITVFFVFLSVQSIEKRRWS
ncbi:MAG: ABC-2 transporter permease [Clostridia bacterium]|nr:ABC-2 transporter permease [Clostridia bacterium]